VLDGRVSDEKLAELLDLQTEHPMLDFKAIIDLEKPGLVELTKDVGAFVLTTSRDGVSWTQPRPVPFGPAQLAVDRFVPALAVDPLTAGSSARLAIVAYAATRAQGCRNASSSTRCSSNRRTEG